MAKKKQKIPGAVNDKAGKVAQSALVKEPAVPFVDTVSDTKLLLFVLCVSAICLIPVLQNDFLAFDDPAYVTDNPLIRQLGLHSIKQFFSQQFVSTYQPLVMLGYAVEYKAFGMNAAGFHFFSLLFHLFNVALVFLLTNRLLKNRVAAMVAALLFGIHPMHVEAVAWVASQKDVLYAFFFLAASLCYLRFVQDGNSRKYYLLSILLFIFSLFCKAQAVVLPVVFILFDMLLRRKINSKTILEKLPFFALSLIFGIVAFALQQATGAIQDFNYFPFYERVLFAAYGFVCYLLQALVPIRLSIFYPYPETLDKINSPFVYVAPFILAALAVLVFKYRKRNPVMLFGALFFCVTIFLVIQLIPVGTAVRADRYSYISLLGIFIFAGSVFSKWYEQWPAKRKMLTALAGGYFIIIGMLSFGRAMVFKDSMAVYDNALEHYPSFMIYDNRGTVYFNGKQYKEALSDFEEVEKIKPAFPGIWYNSGCANQMLGNMPKALADFAEAVKRDIKKLDAYKQMEIIHTALGNWPEALSDAEKMIALNPGMTDAYYMRAEALGRMGRTKEAIAGFDKVISMKPDYADAYNDRGIAYSMEGNNAQALQNYNKVLQLGPKNWNTYFNRSLTLKAMGRYAEAYNDAIVAKQNGHPVKDEYLAELKGKQ